MTQILVAGQNSALTGERVALAVTGPVDVLLLVCNDIGQGSNDDDQYSYNHPAGPGVDVAERSVTLRLDQVRPSAQRLVLIASPADQVSTFGVLPPVGVTISTGATQWTFEPSRLTVERCLVLCEIYRRNGSWKVRAVGQGYVNGLAGVAADYGINVDPFTVATAPAATAPPIAPPPSGQATGPQATAAPEHAALEAPPVLPASDVDPHASAQATQLAFSLAGVCRQANVLYEEIVELADKWSRANWMAEADYVDGVRQHPISKQNFAGLAQKFAREVEPLLHHLRGVAEQGRAMRSDLFLLVGGPTGDTSATVHWMHAAALPSEVQSAIVVQGILISVNFGVTLGSFLAANEYMNGVLESS